LGRGFDTPEVQQPGALGAVGQSLRFPGVDSGLAVADPRSTGGSGTLDGETDRENRAVLGFVEAEIGVDEVYVGGGHADVRLLSEFSRHTDCGRLVDIQDVARDRPGPLTAAVRL
jgi:hypothetical protein